MSVIVTALLIFAMFVGWLAPTIGGLLPLLITEDPEHAVGASFFGLLIGLLVASFALAFTIEYRPGLQWVVITFAAVTVLATMTSGVIIVRGIEARLSGQQIFARVKTSKGGEGA